MTKKHSKCLFVVFAIILVVCLIACFVNFTYPLAINGNYYSYSNFISNVKLGEDVGNSYRIIYEANVPELENEANFSELKLSTMNGLKAIVQAEGYKDVAISEYGEKSICIQVGNILTDEDKDAIISLIGTQASITISTDSAGEEVFATGKDVADIVYGSGFDEASSKGYNVVIVLNDEMKAKAEADDLSSVYLSIDGETPVQLTITDGQIGLSSSTFTSVYDARTFANRLKTAMLQLELTKTEGASITPSYGVGAYVLIGIILIALVLGLFVYLILKYKHMGWIACFNMLFFIVISIFLLQSIPFVHLNFGGILASMVCLLLAVDGVMSILENAKKHYIAGTQFHICFKLALKENLFKSLILNSIVSVLGFACLFMPALSIQSFGWVALVLPIVSFFCSQALFRLFIKMYLALNNTDGKKCNFHKGGKHA